MLFTAAAARGAGVGHCRDGVSPRLSLPTPGAYEGRKGDDIVVAGQFFHTGTPVVLWMDPGGYDAYRVQSRFGPYDESDYENSRSRLDAPRSPNRYDARDGTLTPEQIEQVRGGGWDLRTLQSTVDQFVLHFDTAGTFAHLLQSTAGHARFERPFHA